MEDLDWAFKQFSTKSVGPDGISLKVLKICLPALSRVFLDLLNKFPKAWKHSNILPTAKSQVQVLLVTTDQYHYSVSFQKSLKKFYINKLLII